MEQYDGNPADFATPNAGDDKLFVVFYMGILQDQARSEEEGRPIYHDVEWIRIITPGDNTMRIERPVTADERRRFPRQYAAFKNGMKDEDQTPGMRLSEWPMVSRAMAEELRGIKIYTVEQVAELRDDVMLRVPGLVSLKKQAQVWLGKTKDSAAAAKTAKQLEDLRAQNESLQEANKKLLERVDALMGKLSANA
jgi:FtsZ-binding cell division protein ZapB